MRFLIGVGGVIDRRFGILTSPGHSRGIPMGISAGMDWAGDNDCFKNSFNPDRYFAWLLTMLPYRSTCLFLSVPDVVGNAAATVDSFERWHSDARFIGWPLAFVAQDGQELLDFPDPDKWQTLFVGGSTSWKVSDAAAFCIHRAQQLDMHIHIGRVNWGRRYRYFRGMPGSDDFTCDGTRTRFDGVDVALSQWASYMGAPVQSSLPSPSVAALPEFTDWVADQGVDPDDDAAYFEAFIRYRKTIGGEL